jgi:hypothetical protein
LSRCPFVLGQGQEQMSRDKTLSQNFSNRMTRFSVLEHLFPV